MDDFELEINHGEEPKTAENASYEETADLTTGSPLEEKLNEILSKVSVMETSMTKLTTVFERGGLLSGKTGND